MLLCSFVLTLVFVAETTLGLEGILSLQASLAKFARQCYPEKLEYVDTMSHQQRRTPGTE